MTLVNWNESMNTCEINWDCGATERYWDDDTGDDIFIVNWDGDTCDISGVTVKANLTSVITHVKPYEMKIDLCANWTNTAGVSTEYSDK